MKISAHTILKNEDKFIWYSVMSVINFVDEYLIWDTGSTDNSLKIIDEILKTDIGRQKVKFKKKDSGFIFEEDKLRQKMLLETKGDWFLVVDGDEIWWDESISKVINTIKGESEEIESIVIPTINLVGDIYHFQEENAGHYNLAGKNGHLALRAINKSIPGLSSSLPHGRWGWTDQDGKMIQNRDQDKIKFLNTPYLHTSFMQRSSQTSGIYKRKQKLKHELGVAFPKDYYYPEVFFQKRPDVVKSVWKKMDNRFYIQAFFETPLRRFKRRYLPISHGY